MSKNKKRSFKLSTIENKQLAKETANITLNEFAAYSWILMECFGDNYMTDTISRFPLSQKAHVWIMRTLLEDIEIIAENYGWDLDDKLIKDLPIMAETIQLLFAFRNYWDKFHDMLCQDHVNLETKLVFLID